MYSILKGSIKVQTKITPDFKGKLNEKINLARDKLIKLVKDIKKTDLKIYDLPSVVRPRRIAALDGGGIVKKFMGLTIIPARAAGAIFEKDKKPQWIEKNDVEILTLEDDTRNFTALFRDYLEVSVALELAEEHPEVLILDGSISSYAYKGLPHTLRYLLLSDKEIEEGTKSYRFYQLFIKYLNKAQSLLEYCLENEIILIGVSKDSRTNALAKHLFKNKKKVPLINDTTLVSILAENRTGFTSPFEFKPTIRPIRKKVWEKANVFQKKSLQSFYLSYFILKSGAQPIRVDSLLPQKDRLKEIQEVIVTYHDGNGFITPAYLSHNRAHMRDDLAQLIVNYLASNVLETSPETFKPFFTPQRRDIIQ
ncbi:DNA double-strand break repair nuclease NurA [Candidatus Heimdallarchaeota archaeon]|nr:MAG: DNA double-strand break repair nuclease NurA [Candidatus Heimdallarchaeota archaeon]